MKKLLLIILFLNILLGCSPDDDKSYDPFLASITSVEMPETLVYEETYIFDVSYTRTNSCNVFSGYDYTKTGNEHVFKIVNYYFPEVGNCEEGNFSAQIPLEFTVNSPDLHIFKFWQGEDANGDPQYLIIEVPVEI